MNKEKRFKNKQRCAISNKIVENKEVVLVDYALDYVKKQGYIILKPQKKEEIKFLLVSLLFIFTMFLIMPSGVLGLSNSKNLGTFSQYSSITINTFCANCSNMNFTFVNTDTNNIIVNNKNATKDNLIFTYKINNLTELGNYEVYTTAGNQYNFKVISDKTSKNLFSFNTDLITYFVFGVLLLLSIVSYFIFGTMVSSVLMLFAGFVMLININIFGGIVLICLGIGIAFLDKKNN